MVESGSSCLNKCRHRDLRAALAGVLAISLPLSGNIAMAAAQDMHDRLTEASEQALSLELKGRFTSLYEPSGLAPLSDGRFLIVEDEPNRALRLATPDVSQGEALLFEDETRLKLPSGLTARLSVGPLDDLEGAAHDQQDRIYIVTSHDDSAPYLSSKRQKLLRFSVQDGRMKDVAKKLTLRRDLLASYPQLEMSAHGKSKKKTVPMNIEALAYDRRRDILLIGFRTPVLDNKAIIVRLLNPDAYLNDQAAAKLDESPWSIDLDKGGLRSMTYDDQSDQLILVSRDEDSKKGAYKLWRLQADGQEPAVRIEIGKQEDMLDNVEGLALIQLEPPLGSGLLLVRDNGNEKKGRGGDWFVLPRKQLGLEPG